MSQPPSPLPNNSSGWLSFAKGLTLGNAAAILVLLVGLVPAYVVYRMVTDPALIDRFLSSYEVRSTGTACRLVKAREHGGGYTYAVTTAFAAEGQQKWSLGAVMTTEPSEEEIKSNCALLQAIISFLHGEGAPPDIIWQEKER